MDEEAPKKKCKFNRYFLLITLIVISVLVVAGFVLVLILIFYKKSATSSEGDPPNSTDTAAEQKKLEMLINANEAKLANFDDGGKNNAANVANAVNTAGVNNEGTDAALNMPNAMDAAFNMVMGAMDVVFVTEIPSSINNKEHKIEILSDDTNKKGYSEKIEYMDDTEYVSSVSSSNDT
jgi:hypothetical protein